MNERQLGKRIIKRLTTDSRTEPVLFIAGREYTAGQLAQLDVTGLWGAATGQYIASFVACVRRQSRHKPPRHIYVIRDEAEGDYPADLAVLDATGWQILEMVVTYPPDETVTLSNGL